MTSPVTSPVTPLVHPLGTPQALQRFLGADFALSDHQFAAVSAPLSPAVVIAGAGSGKTTLMAARVAWLVGTGAVAPHEVLGLTFTTKAAGELASKIRGALADAGVLPRPPVRPSAGDVPASGAGGDQPEELAPTVATYNAYAAALLRDHGLRIGHEPDTRVIGDAARYQLAARAVARHTRDVRHLSAHQPTVIGYVLALDAAMSEHLVDPHEVTRLQEALRPALTAQLAVRATNDLRAVLTTFDRREELLHLVRDYRSLKRSLGLMEFSDQIELGARLARSRPEVGSAERGSYKVVLLDEYQDTSVAQAQMLSALFSGPTPEQGRGHAVMAVGDPNQAIYGWRGASVSNILRFGESFPARDGSTGSSAVPRYSLTVNRRSDRRILALANRLAEPLYADMPDVRPLEPGADAGPGEVRAEVHPTYADEVEALPAQVRAAYEQYGSWREVAVLTRDNATAADAFKALSAAEIPVEIVGLKGLLALPEVAEVVATLTLLHDLTDNPALLLLLSGPRWAVGVRDLALLGHRAAELAVSGATRTQGGGGGDQGPRRSIDEELADAVAGADPTEVASLCDALVDPGDGGYSPQARERFALLADELRVLRAFAGEPLLDLVRRIVDTTGIDVELASSVSPAARARRDNLDLFLKGVADFQGIDGEVSLPALLSYLTAEDESGQGMDVATPTPADSVKLLTVHRSKGLEWDAVFLLGVSDKKFPTATSRPRWIGSPGVLPSPLRGDAEDLPRFAGFASKDLAAFRAACQQHAAQEELRLGYVAFTRPRHLLEVSSYLWSPTRQDACGPSEFQRTTRDYLEQLVTEGELPGPLPTWPPVPDRGTPNPVKEQDRAAAWPPVEHTGEVSRRRAAADLVRAEMRRLMAATGASEACPSTEPEPGHKAQGEELHQHVLGHEKRLDDESAALVRTWDDEIERLLAEARARSADRVEVPLPSSLSATALVGLRDEPEAFAERLARPMPRPPAPAARFGTRFHAWVEDWYDRRQDALVDPEELPGRADLGVEGDAELKELVEQFRLGPFAERRDVVVEAPFALVLGGQVVRGRIDAVFGEPDGGVLVVDWKTSRTQTADPLQLAVYRVAWSELSGVPLDRIRAAFCYVRDAEVVEHEDLPDRAGLEQLLSGLQGGSVPGGRLPGEELPGQRLQSGRPEDPAEHDREEQP